MSGIFAKIIAGEIPSYKIAENASCFAFLDINPLTEGHCLIVPKKEIDYLFDLPETDYMELMQFAKQVAKALKMAIPCKRICSVVLGFEIAHAHIHLIPTQNEDQVNFSRPKLKLSKEDFVTTAKKIAHFYEALPPVSA